MPVSPYGQLLTFATLTETRQQDRFRQWVWYNVKVGDTVRKIAARLKTPEDAKRIAEENGIKSVKLPLRYKKIKGKKPRKGQFLRIKVPGTIKSTSVSGSFDVLAGDTAPVIIGGYGKFSVVDRPDRVGMTAFNGYDPITVEVPVRFAAIVSGSSQRVEADIALLEVMAGLTIRRVGPPPPISVLAYNASGIAVPLLPVNRWVRWRVSGLVWDSEPLRDRSARRTTQLATVTLQEDTTVPFATRSVTARAKRPSKKPSTGGTLAPR